MTKLIIRHGERVTEHPITDHALVVGRDPQCDLFFADKKLSRRHARFERERGRIRLVDLGSRNGCWVNDERIEDELLSPTDSIRLGALSISVETELDAGHPDESRPASGDDQDSTHFLSTNALPDAPSPDDVGTVILTGSDAAATGALSQGTIGVASEPRDAGSDEDPTLRRSESADDAPGAEQTVMLAGAAPRVAADTGTVIFRGQSAQPLDAATRVVAVSPEPPSEDEAIAEPFESDASDWDLAPQARVSPSGSLRLLALVVAVAALAVVVLALPLLRTLGGALTAESALRGRALVELLGATNEAALRENRPDALSTARFASEPGVLAAFVVDPAGRILAPNATSDEMTGGVFASLGVDVKAQDIRAFRESARSDGTLIYALPIRAEGRRLGIAVLHYRVGSAVSTWTTVMLLLGSLLLLMGVGAAVVVARRWTLAPVQELRDDVEALRRGIVDNVAEDRPYSDLATIARNFNELAGRGGSQPVGDSSTTYKPRVNPTLVAGKHEQV